MIPIKTPRIEITFTRLPLNQLIIINRIPIGGTIANNADAIIKSG